MNPRPALVVAPILITTMNCVAAAGIDERRLRELLLRHPDVRRVVPGTRLVGIEPRDLLALLEGEAQVPPLRLVDDPETVDDVLAAIGRRAAGGAR